MQEGSKKWVRARNLAFFVSPALHNLFHLQLTNSCK
jgi:hypothetical protein